MLDPSGPVVTTEVTGCCDIAFGPDTLKPLSSGGGGPTTNHSKQSGIIRKSRLTPELSIWRTYRSGVY